MKQPRWMRRAVLLIAAPLCLAALILITATNGCSTDSSHSTTAPGPVGVPGLSATAALTDTVDVVFGWTSPTSGSVVAIYECQWSHGQLDYTIHTKRRFGIPYGVSTKLRVRGISGEGLIGEWSAWSAYFPDNMDTRPADIDRPYIVGG